MVLLNPASLPKSTVVDFPVQSFTLGSTLFFSARQRFRHLDDDPLITIVGVRSFSRCPGTETIPFPNAAIACCANY